MFRLKRDQDLSIEITHGFAIAIGKIDSAGGQADVIQDATQLRGWYHPPDHVLRFAGDARRFFDACAGLGPQMESQLTGVNRRKEVLAQVADEHQACEAEDQKTDREYCPMIQTQLEKVRIAALYGIEAALDTVMNACEDAPRLFLFRMLIPGRFLLHQVHDQSRHQCARKEVRRQ